MDVLVRRLNREGMTGAEIVTKTTLPNGIVQAILG